MLRHIPQPLHAGGLEADVGVEAAGDGAVDDGLLLLLQQLDQLLLGADVPPNPPVRVIEEADDGGLFGEGRESVPHSPNELPISPWHLRTEGRTVHGIDDRFGPQQLLQVRSRPVRSAGAKHKELPYAHTAVARARDLCQIRTQLAEEDVPGTEALYLTIEGH